MLSLLPLAGLSAQQASKDRNFRTESIIRKAGVTDIAQADSLPMTESIRRIYYYDGFGYPLQEISVGAAKDRKDLVLHKHYDSYRRENRIYLPYADNGEAGGKFRPEAVRKTLEYYADSVRSGMQPTGHPYSETIFEQSMLDRVLEQGELGEIWQLAPRRDGNAGRTVLTEYGTCQLEETVKLFRVTDDGLAYQADYFPGTLVKTVLKDENWNGGRIGTREVYKDREGRNILERRILEEEGKEQTLDTYYVYDDLGRIVADRRNGTESLRTGYAYNIRNWTTDIESPLFREELHYTDGTGTPCYNGNISSICWKAGEEQTPRGYRFAYDGLDRMKTAEYGEGERLAENPNRFNEEVTAYDKMGNILEIKRTGQTGAKEYGLIDNLSLTYHGNRLTKVTDNAAGAAYDGGFEFRDGADEETEYTYDENGNLTQDLNRNIRDIQYNFLNLPLRIEFGDGSTTEYLYDAEGRKLRTVHKADGKTITTDYAGNLIYENGKPLRLVTGYGYVSLPDGMYHYYLQDHLGNNRVVADRNGKVEEVNHYYPFGGIFANSGNVQPYKYNGKELDTHKGLNWYDYGARHYDATLGRWHVQDPMAEKYYNTSQYAYCMNSPVKYIDPDGCDVKPAGTAELIMIQNTLPKEARSYVRLDKNGLIDRTLLNSYGGKSLNFNNLKTMVNSDKIVEVVLDDKFTFMGQDGKLGTETMPYNSFDPKYDLESDKDLKGETMGGLSTGESGFMGKTLFPDKDGIQNSPNGNIIVIINKNLSPAGAAENYSHEANGHALLYILNGGNHKGASHQPINDQWIEGNKTLMKMIINSKKETIKNMQGR